MRPFLLVLVMPRLLSRKGGPCKHEQIKIHDGGKKTETVQRGKAGKVCSLFFDAITIDPSSEQKDVEFSRNRAIIPTLAQTAFKGRLVPLFLFTL